MNGHTNIKQNKPLLHSVKKKRQLFENNGHKISHPIPKLNSRFRDMNSGTDFGSYDVSPENLDMHRSILNPASVMFYFSFTVFNL